MSGITKKCGSSPAPVISSIPTNVTLVIGQPQTITPSTANYNGSSTFFETSGYQFTIGDVRTMSSFTATGINTPEATALNATVTVGTNVSKTVIGTTLNMTATTIRTLFGSSTASILNTTLTIVGRDSGARLTIPVKITQS